MNFLAHAFLARKSERLLVGNFIGDFVKGNQYEQYHPVIIAGILLHRKIDEFTDNHPIFKRSRKRIRDKYRHYSGVIIDLFYDHFLAKNWNAYANEPLEDFADQVYRIMRNHFDTIPARAKNMLPYMIKYNWLVNYATIEGIDQSLKGISKRTNHVSGMENASHDLLLNYREFDRDFSEFFPEIIAFTEDRSIIQ
jgi:acyl carrier protein phosphodiesterase